MTNILNLLTTLLGQRHAQTPNSISPQELVPGQVVDWGTADILVDGEMTRVAFPIFAGD